jgi:hypothetical protein
MLTRYKLIERIRSVIYNGTPNDDATITFNLVNEWLNDAIGIVAKANYVESIKLDGISYLNNAFYSSFSDLSITQDNVNLYKFQLPEYPIGIGDNQGIASVVVTNSNGNVSYDAVPLTTNQVSYVRGRRTPPNKMLYYNENSYIFLLTSVPLYDYTAQVRLVSAGDSSDLDSVLNVPSDYIPQIIDYIVKNLLLEHSQKLDLASDGNDSPTQQ